MLKDCADTTELTSSQVLCSVVETLKESPAKPLSRIFIEADDQSVGEQCRSFSRTQLAAAVCLDVIRVMKLTNTPLILVRFVVNSKK